MTVITLSQWCTTFFGQGPLFDFLNSSGAKQVRRLSLCPMNACETSEDDIRSKTQSKHRDSKYFCISIYC